MVGCEAHLPYHRPPLSKAFLSAAKPPRMAALAQRPASWYEKNKIELRLDLNVVELDIDRRVAVLESGQAIEFKKACLATGSRPRRPNVAGAVLGNVFYLHSVRDALSLREMAAAERSVVVIGGGFIGVEASCALRQNGCKITLLNRHQFIWEKWLDPETARWLTTILARRGISLMMQEDLNGFEGKTFLRNVQTKSGKRFPATVALVGVGTELNLEIVSKTPLSSPNGTPVNEFLETDEKGIFAAGDIALYPDKIFGGIRRLDHWDSAITQGGIAGANMTGKKRIKFEYVPYFFTDLFDLKFEFLGDFSALPDRVELEGTRVKKKFALRYFRRDRLVARVFCNTPMNREKVAAEIVAAQR